jgi:hypothetical protein
MKLEIEGVEFEIGESLSEIGLAYYVEVSRANKKYHETDDVKDGIHFLNIFSGKDFNFLLNSDYTMDSVFEAIGNARVLFNVLATSWKPPVIHGDFYKFEYKGIQYKTSIYKVGDVVNGKLSYGEYSECREADRHIDRKDDGTTEFSAMCKFIAVIAKPLLGPKESYESVREFVEETNSKAMYFQEIDAKTGLDIDFFFGNTLGV